MLNSKKTRKLFTDLADHFYEFNHKNNGAKFKNINRYTFLSILVDSKSWECKCFANTPNSAITTTLAIKHIVDRLQHINENEICARTRCMQSKDFHATLLSFYNVIEDYINKNICSISLAKEYLVAINSNEGTHIDYFKQYFNK